MARPPQRQDKLLHKIRSKIQDGKFSPGSRIPPRSELARDYKVSPVTVQRVFDRLIEDGYVRPRGRNGSFVVDAPPHLNHYWIIFPYREEGFPTPFRDALVREARHFSRSHEQTFSVHIGHGGNFRRGNYRQLLHDVTTRRTAGIIFATAGSYWHDTPLRKEPGIPRLALSHNPAGPEDIALVRFDTLSFIDKALDAFKAQGKSRVAVLAPSLGTAAHEHFLQGLVDRGMQTKPYWQQLVHVHHAAAARNVMHLMFNPDQQLRPDALLVMDDALVARSIDGLLDAGVSIPDKLCVIAHANFPNPVRCPAPLKYLGYDISSLLENCLAVLAAQRNNEQPAHVTPLSAVFEHELSLPANRT